MSNKTQRQEALIQVIEEGHISSHEELMQALKKKGIFTGQATISRDLYELGISRVKGVYQKGAESEPRWKAVLRQRIKTIAPAGANLLIVKGELGSAPIVSVEIEAQNWPEIVGVIAGDDTLFFAFKNEKDLKKIYKKLSQAL